MKKILAYLSDREIGELLEIGTGTEFRYFTDNPVDSICISMPANNLTYKRHTGLIPFFDMFIPEGFLFEYLKNIIHKREGNINDFTILWYLAEGIKSKAKFKSRQVETNLHQEYVTIEEIESNDTYDTFLRLLQIFLNRNAISGIQPKTLVVVKDKANLSIDEYIIKTSGEAYPKLTECEYFCLKVAEKSGLKVPEFRLSKNKNFLIIKRFDNENTFFEEIGSLLKKTRLDKYTGSYEQIAKKIKEYSYNVEEDLKDYFKMIVVNNLIRNGDAHLKNFGLLFNKDFSNIRLAPAYDLICTTAYIKDDKPALTINGKKQWLTKKELVEFGKNICLLSEQEAKQIIDTSVNAVEETIKEIKNYIQENKEFEEIGTRMINIWKSSFKELEYRFSIDINREKKNGFKFNR